MSFFTAVLVSDGSSWRVRDVGVEDVADLDELAESLRTVAAGDNPVLAVIEREDQWFALVRADGQDDVRAFVSDSVAGVNGHYAALLAPVAELGPDLPARVPQVTGDTVAPSEIEAVAEADGEDVVGDEPPAELREDVDLERLAAQPAAVTLAAPQPWAGDADLLADLGVDAEALLDLVLENPDDPAAVLADLGEQLGFGELLESLR